MNEINKPLSMVVKETKAKLAKICNESGLSPIHLDLIMYGLYLEIHMAAERQTIDEEAFYAKMLEEASKKTEVADNNVE